MKRFSTKAFLLVALLHIAGTIILLNIAARAWRVIPALWIWDPIPMFLVGLRPGPFFWTALPWSLCVGVVFGLLLPAWSYQQKVKFQSSSHDSQNPLKNEAQHMNKINSKVLIFLISLNAGLLILVVNVCRRTGYTLMGQKVMDEVDWSVGGPVMAASLVISLGALFAFGRQK